MNKKELYEVLKQKISISDNELNEIYDVLKKQMEERGKTSEESILQRMYAYLSPSLRSNATKHIGVYLGVEDNFMFNKKTQDNIFDSMKMYQEDKQTAINLNVIKEVEEKGEKKLIPIWHNVDGISVQDFQLGQPITDLDYSATAYLFVEKDDKKELQTLNLRGKRRDFVLKNNKSLQYKKVQFSAIDRQDKPMNDSTYLNMQSIEDKEVDVTQLISTYAKKQRVNLKDLIQYYQENVDEFVKTKTGYLSKFPVFIRGTVGSIFLSELKDNNIIEVKDLNYEKQFSVFLPKSLEVPAQGTPDVIFGGKLRFNEKDANRPFSMNCFMCYVSLKSRDLKRPEIINKWIIKEENIEDTSLSQELLQKEEAKSDW